MFGNNFQNDIKGILLNLKQDEPFNDNYLLGLVADEAPLRGDRIHYQWYPGMAKTRAESQQLQHSKPLEDCVYAYPAGSIEKHYPVWMVLPDTYRTLPSPIQKIQPGANNELPSLGAVLNKIMYEHQTQLEMLKVVAEQQPDQLEKMKELAYQSNLDEAKRKEMVQLLDDVLGSINRHTKSSNG